MTSNQAHKTVLLGALGRGSLVAAWLLVVSPVAAGPEGEAPPAPVAPADTASPSAPPSPESVAPRPWLYAADPTGPLPGHAVASLGVGYAQVDRGAARPFAA